jgi:selenocysteine lyase/cysteine desulfurase
LDCLGSAGDAALDAIFVSPHKFLGGPGSSGVLVFNERLYHRELPPSVSAGGTVDYVGPTGQDFIRDVEEREKPGTPGVLQILKAGLAFEIKDRVGVAAIERRERELLRRVFTRWQGNPDIEILGNPDPDLRLGYAYIMNKLDFFLLNDPREKALRDALYRAIGKLG